MSTYQLHYQVPYIGQGSFGVAYASLGKSAPWPCPVGGGVSDPRSANHSSLWSCDARSRWLYATCLDNVTPNTGSPCVATVQFGGVSRPSNVRASARSMSQWVCSLLGFFIVPRGCGVPSLIVSSAPRSNLSLVRVVDRWVWMLLLVRNGHVSGEMVVCVGRLRASGIELSSRTPLQCPPLVAVVTKGCDRDPVLRT
ncbi:hypothetical protein V6N13_008265 [Hibiscus sabdariffa]